MSRIISRFPAMEVIIIWSCSADVYLLHTDIFEDIRKKLISIIEEGESEYGLSSE